MNVEFLEDSHTYIVNGEIASISVTELLRKHGLAPDYSGVSSEKLRESAESGKAVHKDLENILNQANYCPLTEQGRQFGEWVKNNLDCGRGEQILAYEKDGMIIAGTADVMGVLKDGKFLVADHKNTKSFHREYVSWQVSLLDYFATKLGAEPINGKILKWKGATRFICFHYDPVSGDMEAIELSKIPTTEIEKLLECEYNNELYERPTLVVEPELEIKFLRAEQALSDIETQYKNAEAQAKAVREELLKVFEQQHIKSWESLNGIVKVTYVDPYDRIDIDKKKLKKDYPKAYSECQKLTKVKAQIKVKVKYEESEDE